MQSFIHFHMYSCFRVKYVQLFRWAFQNGGGGGGKLLKLRHFSPLALTHKCDIDTQWKVSFTGLSSTVQLGERQVEESGERRRRGGDKGQVWVRWRLTKMYSHNRIMVYNSCGRAGLTLHRAQWQRFNTGLLLTPHLLPFVHCVCKLSHSKVRTADNGWHVHYMHRDPETTQYAGIPPCLTFSQIIIPQLLLVSFSSSCWFYSPKLHCFGSVSLLPWALFSAALCSCFRQKRKEKTTANQH